MKKIGITGIEGLIGWHLHAFLHGQKDVSVVRANRSTFTDHSKLCDFVKSCDVIVHLAGMNRGDENEVFATNIKLTDDLIATCESLERKPHIIFSSSTHIHRDTLYGKTKKICTAKFLKWSEQSGALFTNMVLPNVFGESGKPFYNSVVSTFCFQVVYGQEPKIINDITTEQVHAQQVAREIYEIINSSKCGDVVLSGVPITVSELLIKIKNFNAVYQQHIIPDLRENFELCLFNTYRSYLYPSKSLISATLHSDNRGTLFEAVKSLNGGQTFISTTKSGITRGNHYHTKKMERFFVLCGQAEIKIRKLFSEKTEIFTVNGTTPQYIDIPTLHTHNITNTGRDELITLFWSHEIFNPEHPDTFPETV